MSPVVRYIQNKLLYEFNLVVLRIFVSMASNPYILQGMYDFRALYKWLFGLLD